MWRKFPARVNADAGVEVEIFRRAGSLHGVICGAKTRDDSSRQRVTLSAPRFYAKRSSGPALWRVLSYAPRPSCVSVHIPHSVT